MHPPIGIFTCSGNSIEQRRELFRIAQQLIGEIVFVETFIFNYRGRLLSLNNDHSLNIRILAADDVFRVIRIDLSVIIEIAKIPFQGSPAITKESFMETEGCCCKDSNWHNNAITVYETAPIKLRKKVFHKFKRKIVFIQTLIYNYVGIILDTTDEFITFRQFIDYRPQFSIDFRISTSIILNISDIP